MKPRLPASGSAAIALLGLHTRLWRNCLEGAADVLWRRPVPEVNALGFLALHLIDSRRFTARLLGAEVEHPFVDLLEETQSMDDLTGRPPLEELIPAWEHVSEALERVVARAPAASWESGSSHGFPIDDPTLRGALGFLLHHEAYHIGQMGYLRRCHGLPAMRYDQD